MSRTSQKSVRIAPLALISSVLTLSAQVALSTLAFAQEPVCGGAKDDWVKGGASYWGDITGQETSITAPAATASVASTHMFAARLQDDKITTIINAAASRCFNSTRDFYFVAHLREISWDPYEGGGPGIASLSEPKCESGSTRVVEAKLRCVMQGGEHGGTVRHIIER